MSDLRDDERAFLASDKRCEHCEHLSAFHWSDDEGAGCSLPECECYGMSVDMSGYAPPDPNDPIPRIWSSEVTALVDSANMLNRLVRRNLEDDARFGDVISIQPAQYVAFNVETILDVG